MSERDQTIIVLFAFLGLFVSLSGSSLAAPTTEPVDAADLIKDAKQRQDWLAHVKSFRVRFEGETVTYLPAGAVTRPQARVATTQPISGATERIERRMASGLIMAFDQHRLYKASRLPGSSFQSVRFWDGKTAGYSGREGYFEFSDSPESIERAFMASIMWGRTGQNYWWVADRATKDDLVGAAEAYRFVTTESFHGIECYVLQADQPPNRCYVGVADHRLYGLTRMIALIRTSMTSWYADYKEVSPGCWFPMTQGEDVLDMSSRNPPVLTQAITRRVTDIEVDEPLAEDLFKPIIKEGTHVHDTRGGKTLDYVNKER